jgi:hypothetical protein
MINQFVYGMYNLEIPFNNSNTIFRELNQLLLVHVENISPLDMVNNSPELYFLLNYFLHYFLFLKINQFKFGKNNLEILSNN